MYALELLRAEFPGLAELGREQDALGQYAIFALEADPVGVKRRCVAIESRELPMRLLDLDVYSANASQIDRHSIGLVARTCLLCDQPAVDCIRAKRHLFQDVIGRVHALLARFRA